MQMVELKRCLYPDAHWTAKNFLFVVTLYSIFSYSRVGGGLGGKPPRCSNNFDTQSTAHLFPTLLTPLPRPIHTVAMFQMRKPPPFPHTRVQFNAILLLQPRAYNLYIYTSIQLIRH